MTTTYLFDLTITEDEIRNAQITEGVAFKADGSVNIRRSVFNIMRQLSRLGDVTVQAFPAAVWGNNAFVREQIAAVLFQLGVELEQKQVDSAVAFWVTRGIVKRVYLDYYATF